MSGLSLLRLFGLWVLAHVFLPQVTAGRTVQGGLPVPYTT